MDEQQLQIDDNNTKALDNQKDSLMPMPKPGGASVYGIALNPTIKKEMNE